MALSAIALMAFFLHCHVIFLDGLLFLVSSMLANMLLSLLMSEKLTKNQG